MSASVKGGTVLRFALCGAKNASTPGSNLSSLTALLPFGWVSGVDAFPWRPSY